MDKLVAAAITYMFCDHIQKSRKLFVNLMTEAEDIDEGTAQCGDVVFGVLYCGIATFTHS
jgi:hypothetical protein